MRRILTAVLAVATVASAALADAPAYLPVQGYLTNADGTPLDRGADFRFRLLTAEAGGTELFVEDQTLLVEDGFFTAYVGDTATTPLDLAVFRDNDRVFLEITVNAESLGAYEVATTGFAGFAQYCGEATDSLALGGMEPSDFAATTHTHAWDDITSGVPAGLDDGDDVGFTTEAELTALLDDNYTYTGTAPIAVAANAVGLSSAGCPTDAAWLWTGSDWSCEVPAGAGDITGIITPATGGLAGGAMSGDATLAIATDGVTAAMIAADAVGASEISAGAVTTSEILDGTITFTDTDTASVQRRVTGTCIGRVVVGINADGTAACEDDNNTTYSASRTIGIVGATNMISLESATCPDGGEWRWSLMLSQWSCQREPGGDVTDVLPTSGGGIQVTSGAGPQPSVGLRTDCTASQVLKCDTTNGWYCASDLIGSLVCMRVPLGVGVANGNPFNVSADCATLGAGYSVTGGGYSFAVPGPPLTNVWVSQSAPSGTAWVVAGLNNSGMLIAVQAYAVCCIVL